MPVIATTKTVKELVQDCVIERPIDGNHGETHPKTTDYVQSGIPFVMANNLINGKVDYSSCNYITRKQADSLRKGFAKEGDVLLTHKATIGRTALLEEVPTDYVMLTPQVTYYRVINDEILSRKYLKYYFDSKEFQILFNQWAGGGSTRSYLGITDQLKLPITYPVIDIQRKIVQIISAYDDKIELNKKMNETLEEMARAIFKSWFVDFDPVHAKARGEKPAGMPDEIADLFPSEFVHSDELNKPIPKGWQARPLKEIIEFNPTTPLKKGVRSPYVEMSNLPEQGMSIKNFYHREFSSGSKFQNGDTLFARITPCLENGKTAFVDCLNDNEVGWGSTEFIVMRSKPKIGSFISYLIARSDWLRAAAIGSMNGSSGRQRASKEALEELLIAVPPEDVFEAFNTVAEIISKKIKLSHEESQNLANVRDSLLPKLISGEIEV